MAFSQGDILPDDPTIFADSVNTILTATRNEGALEVAENFSMAWQSLDQSQQTKVIAQSKSLLAKGYKVRPALVAYLKSIANAINKEGLESNKLTEYLNMTASVIENQNREGVLNYLRTMNAFFSHRALYHANSNKLFVLNDSYSFEYVATEVPVEEIPEVVEEQPADDEWADEDTWEEEDDWEDDDWEDDDWDDEDDWEEDDWEDDDWDTEWTDEESSDEDMLAAVTGGNVLPVISGPVIRFEKVDLNFVTPYDSVFISGGKGDFLIATNQFVGAGGRFDWSMAGLSSDSVFATFTDYSFNTTKPYLKAESAKLTYKGKVKDPVDGAFEYRSVRHDTTTTSTYPRFESYYANIRLQDLGQDLIYKGGFSMRGSKILSTSILGGTSMIEVQNKPAKLFRARAKVFEFKDSTIRTERASLVIYQGNDSIYHPSVRLKYDYNSKQLVVQKDKGPFKDTPFTSTFFNVDFTADIIRWDLKSDSLDASILGARRMVPSVIESAEHYSYEDYRSLGDKLYNFNPLSLVVYYANKEGTDEFYVSDLAKSFRKDEKIIRGAMVFLARKGLIGFDAKNDLVTVKQKAHHLYNSKAGKTDYDDIILASVTHTDPNITLNFKERKLKIRGVEQFKVSDSLNVMIEPDSSEITFLQDRDFSFNGKVRAGNFEYIGRNFTFKYDSFLIYLNEIDSIQFYVGKGNNPSKKVDNTLVSTDSVSAGDVGNNLQSSSGTLYINKPSNKSGKVKNTNFPKFDSKKGAVVYFDRPNVLAGAYDRSVYFMVPPFDLDSLGDSDPSTIGFEGSFISSGMFPVFEEKLSIMEDNSLGFYHKVPPEGYQLYEGEGTFYDDLKLDKGGLRGSGTIDFLTTTMFSDDFIFYPDSVVATGKNFSMREEDYGGIIFPQANLSDFKMKWLPKKDSMYISNIEEPLHFYDETAALDGTAIISNSGVYGKGKLLTRGSVSESNEMTFEKDRFSARHAQFELESENPDKPALYGDDVRLAFNLEQNYAVISPEVEGEAAIAFPFAQFKTSITQARWDLIDEKITMSKPEDVPLESSYFYTTREDLDSLRFNATEAEYDINTSELKVSGIPFIVVADAKITPENNEVLILENSRIGTLTNTTIILDTLNEYHRLTEGVIDIKSRNEFSGYATYQFVNALNDTLPIKVEDFRLEEVPVPGSRKGETERHTVANGSISETQNIVISPSMFYKGDMTLYAHKPAMQLDGFIKLDLNRAGYNTWIEHSSTGDQKEVMINFDKALTEDGRRLEAGINFSAGDNSLYTTFIEEKYTPDDEDFFTPSGMLFFDQEKNQYVIEDSLKAAGKSLAGKIFRFNDDTGYVEFEGPVNFVNPAKDVNVNAAAIGVGNNERSEFSLNTFITLNFEPVPSQAFDLMAADMIDVINNLGAPEGLGDQTQLLYKLADIAGERVAREYEERSMLDYVPLGEMSKQSSMPLTFANVDFKYSSDYQAFYSEGKLGLSNINRYDLNAAFDGFFEIKKNEAGGPVLNLFVKASAASWFYFSLEDSRLLVYSSNNNFNDVISKKSNGSKAKLGDLIFAPASKAEVLNYINRFRLQYYGIDDIYELDAEIEDPVDDPNAQDGFGGTEDEDDGFEDDDDGF
ncbi:hypothetical protein E1176_12720 [Fulvivirga sp. RKSG066]|uniref:hypothetical protein n=1 Tax=Fulvivirga aurantia TaxID=2529383 RepID=UPI0012BBF2AD|nr:hypothetical protein [Fulvivirga aurantia]MTI21888.1 hypothetical protein [Fulvivirga aurantia]